VDGIFNIFIVALSWLIIVSATMGFGLIPLAAWGYLVFSGSEARASKAEVYLRDSLMNGENLVASGVEKRPAALMSRRKVIGITDSRIILIKRGLFGGFTMLDQQWKDLRDIKLSELVLGDICGSKVECHFLKDEGFSACIENSAARTIYKEGQNQEQAWEEKRRVRDMEENRAASGGFMMQIPQVPVQQSQSNNYQESALDQIKKAKEMLDSGIISDSEYNEIKAKILSGNF